MAKTNEGLAAWVGSWGVSFSSNLTPEPETGMGRWTVEQFIQTMRIGKHPGVGRPVLPPMAEIIRTRTHRIDRPCAVPTGARHIPR